MLGILAPLFDTTITNVASDTLVNGYGHAAVLVPVIAGLVLLAVFVIYAYRKGDEALLDVKLFRLRPFTVSSTLLFLSGLTTYGANAAAAAVLPASPQRIIANIRSAARSARDRDAADKITCRQTNGSDRFEARRSCRNRPYHTWNMAAYAA